MTSAAENRLDRVYLSILNRKGTLNLKRFNTYGKGISLFVAGVLAGVLLKLTLPWLASLPERAAAQNKPIVPLSTADTTAVRLPAYRPAAPDLAVVRFSQIHTERPDRPRFGILRYTVQAGDTPWSIAQKFDLRMESILWGNEGMSADAGSLQIGQQINILPEDGVVYTVQKDDTWEIIEYRNGVAREKIIEYPGNNFQTRASVEIVEGEQLIIPGGRKPVVWVDPGPQVEPGKGRKSTGFYSGDLVTIGTGVYILPVTPVRITQPYWDGHPAIDYDTVTGQPVYAADGGTVIFSGMSQSGYGNLVIIDHGTGYWTYYGHNDVNLVEAGQGVYQGQQIALSGNTGRSTGDHLDFRIRVAGGAFIDPTPLMPKQ